MSDGYTRQVDSQSGSQSTHGCNLVVNGVLFYFLYAAYQSLKTNSCYATQDSAGNWEAFASAPADVESVDVGKAMSTWMLWGMIFLAGNFAVSLV